MFDAINILYIIDFTTTYLKGFELQIHIFLYHVIRFDIFHLLRIPTCQTLVTSFSNVTLTNVHNFLISSDIDWLSRYNQ